MNKEYVWWSLVNSSAFFISQIKNAIEKEENVFICCENSLPWKNAFYELTGNALSEISSQRSLEFISAKNESDPGRFIMTKMCPQSVRSEYWPNMTYAEFLSQYDNLVLNNRIVWIKDIENDSMLEKWFEFIVEYCRLSDQQEHDHAIFIIEHSGKRITKKAPSSIEQISYIPTYFDRYIFALSMLSELKNAFSVKQYIAELACCLCSEDVELCGNLVESGLRLIKAPTVYVAEQLKNYRSDGVRFASMDNDHIYSRILMAQIKIIFPVIEQFRLSFIKEHESAIRENFPIVNSFGEKIEEPSDLELTDLCSISRVYNSGITDSEKVLLLKYKNYRNKLAHNNILDYQEVEKILTV